MGQVGSEALRATLSRKPSDELRRMVASGEGNYTTEALAVAREILSQRPRQDEAAASHQDADAASEAGHAWSDVGFYLVGVYCVKQLFYLWRASERNPDAITEAISRLGSSPWSYAVVAMLAWSVWRRVARRPTPGKHS